MGRAWVFEDNLSTDSIMPGRYSASADKSVLKENLFKTSRPELVEKVKSGDIVVGGKNFGCGSSRESAALGIKVNGIECVVAMSFGWIFKRNCINIGLLALEILEEAHIEDGDEVRLDLENFIMMNLTKKTEYKLKPPHPLILKICKEGGLIQYLNKEGDYVLK